MNRVLGICFVVVTCATVVADAEDFCIQSRVNVGKDVIESSTIFYAGRVYDFLSEPAEVTIFDPPGKKFVVLNPVSMVKTEIDLPQIDAFALYIKNKSLERPVPLLAFLAEPKFDETYDDGSGNLTLKSEWMDYEVKTVKPRSDEAASIYVDYSNWQTKLNTLMRPGSLPPFARLELNKALDHHHRLPTEVQLIRYAGGPTKRAVTIRAEHRLQWRLLESDIKRIDETATNLVTARPVGLTEYRSIIAAKSDSE